MDTSIAQATEELLEVWPGLTHAERLRRFPELHTGEKADLYFSMARVILLQPH